MRRFHNKVKEEALSWGGGRRVIETLLDFGCGRGGDVHKWNRLGIQHVFGIDPCRSSIQEATKRSIANSNYIFIQADNPLEWLVRECHSNSFDMISCNFVIHYFDKTQQKEILREFFRVLEPGGTVVMTFMEGSRVFTYLQGETVRDNGVANIQLSFPKIIIGIKDTPYFESQASEEFLVFEKYLLKESEIIGFKTVCRHPFESIYNTLSPPPPQLSNNEKETSFLFSSLILLKPYE